MKNLIRLLFIFNMMVAFEGLSYASDTAKDETVDGNAQSKPRGTSSVDGSVTGDDSNKSVTTGQKGRFAFKCPTFDFRSWLTVPSFLKRGVAKVEDQAVDINAGKSFFGRNKRTILVSTGVGFISVGAGIYFYKPEWVAAGLQILQGLAVNGTALAN
jgi:hypothetical protein